MPLGNLEELQAWGTDANCYAYAVNCPNPVNGRNGGANPGSQAAFAGHPAPGGATLAQKVVADGNHSVVQVAGTTLNPPAAIPGNYVIAMLSHQAGFHFIRRDSHTGRWSWKDGNTGSVKFNLLDMANQRYIYIRDENLNDLLVASPANFFPWVYSNMAFVAYFRVPTGGSTVRGR